MSDFSEYLLFREPFDPTRMLEKVGATGLVIHDPPFSIVVSPDHQGIVEARVPFALDYQFDEEDGFKLRLWNNGTLITKLVASSDGERRSNFDRTPWIEHGFLTETAAIKIAEMLTTDTFTHTGVRNLVAKEIGFRPISLLQGEHLEDDIEVLSERFPDADFVQNGERTKRDSLLDFNMSEIDKILDDEKKQARKNRW